MRNSRYEFAVGSFSKADVTALYGQPNGITPLDINRKISDTNLSTHILNSDSYMGEWNASGGVYPSNSTRGDWYNIIGSGTINSILHNVGDWIYYSGTSWIHADNSNGHNHNTLYYTKTELSNGQLNTLYYPIATIDQALSGKSNTGHTHDDRYYTETELSNGQLDSRYFTESEVTSALSGKSNTGHTHDDRYYTETEIDNMKGVSIATLTDGVLTPEQIPSSLTSGLNPKGTWDASVGFLPLNPSNGDLYIIDVAGTINDELYSVMDWIFYANLVWHHVTPNNSNLYTKTEVNNLLAGKSNTGHTHDDRYYTETETQLLLTGTNEYSEITRVSGRVIQVDRWTASNKITKIDSTVITRTSGLVSSIVQYLYDSGNALIGTLTTNFTRSNGSVTDSTTVRT